MGRYNFYEIFSINQSSGLITPRFTVSVSGIRFIAGVVVSPGITFGGINLYNYIGKDIAGNWNATTRELEFLGFYNQ